jgi:hypothetical protein
MKRPVPARVVVSVFSESVPKTPAVSSRPLPFKIPALTLTLLFAALMLILAFAPTTTSAAAPTFTVGMEVTTVAKTNVRATADGTLLGTQPRFAIGVVTAAPVFVTADSAWWVKVAFVSGPSGWVGADMLVDGVPTPKTVVVGNGTGQTMILDELGNIDVAFTSNTGANNTNIYSFTESTNQGLAFSTPTVLPALMFTDFAIPAPLGPQVATERSGAIDMVYSCPFSLCPENGGNPEVELIRSTDHGVTWSAPVQISLPPHRIGSGAGEPVIAACGAGVTIAWQDDGVGSHFTNMNPDIFVVQVLNGVPGAPMNVTDTGASEGHPQIAVSPQSTVYLSWVSDNDNNASSTPFDTVNFAAIPNCAAVQN